MDSVPEQSCRNSPCNCRSILHTPMRVEIMRGVGSSGDDFQRFSVLEVRGFYRSRHEATLLIEM